MLTEYTSYADVRAALGVSEEEIDDETLDLPIFGTLLDEALLEVNAAVLPAWNGLPADADRTADEARFAALVSLFSTYAVAYELLNSAELFGFLKVADGRASTERTTDAFKNLRANIAAMRKRVKALLLAALLVIEPETSIPTVSASIFVSAVGGATDPVTE